MNDNEVRALISEMRATHSKRDGNPDAYRLALIAEELMVQRDRRSEDFYRSNRVIHVIEGQRDDAERKLKTLRADVAEEIAQAIEAEADRDVDKSDLVANTMRFTARIARQHGKES